MVNNLKTQEEKQKKAQEIFSYLPTEGLSEERRYCFAVDMFNYHSGIAYYTVRWLVSISNRPMQKSSKSYATVRLQFSSMMGIGKIWD